MRTNAYTHSTVDYPTEEPKRYCRDCTREVYLWLATGLQFDAPGTNASRWKAIWEIAP